MVVCIFALGKHWKTKAAGFIFNSDSTVNVSGTILDIEDSKMK